MVQVQYQNPKLNWSILSAETMTDTKTLVDNLLTHCSTINVQSPTHLFLSIWNEVIKVRLSQREFMKLSILENSNWKIWRFSALASKMRSNKKIKAPKIIISLPETFLHIQINYKTQWLIYFTTYLILISNYLLTNNSNYLYFLYYIDLIYIA